MGSPAIAEPARPAADILVQHDQRVVEVPQVRLRPALGGDLS